jgi:hypothetical protein
MRSLLNAIALYPTTNMSSINTGIEWTDKTWNPNQIGLLLIAILTILSIASPTLAARDDQTGDCIKKGKCKD